MGLLIVLLIIGFVAIVVAFFVGLAVRFQTEEGTDEAAAFWVPDISEWASHIAAVARGPVEIEAGGSDASYG